MKRFFETPKRAALSAVCITLLALFAVGAVFTAVSITGFSFSGKEITLERAKEIALADAGIMDSEAVFTKTKQEMERGVSMYEIEFYAGNTEYEYEINGTAGKIYSKSKETLTAPLEDTVKQGGQGTAQSSQSGEQNAQSTDQNTQGAGNQGTPQGGEATIPDSGAGNTGGADIGVEKAKEIAAGHAGFSVSDVVFSKTKLESEHGSMVYEIEFYKDKMEYEYDINASTGEIVKFDSELDD